MIPVISAEQADAALMSGEELYDLGNMERTELIEGKIKTMPPTGFLHGDVELTIGSLLRNFVYRNQLGRVMTGEVGIFTHRNPDTVRGADVLYISQERLQQVKADSFLDVAPELVIIHPATFAPTNQITKRYPMTTTVITVITAGATLLTMTKTSRNQSHALPSFTFCGLFSIRY